jgi:hypothetical protein
MKKLIKNSVLFVLVIVLVGAPVYAQSDQSAADCSTYARNQADMHAPSGGGILGGAVRGAVGGAVFGGIIGGRRGSRRGARLAGVVGAVGGGIRANQERKSSYQYYYDSCMRG